MKATKRIISVLLCVLMLGSLCVCAFAEESNSKYPHFDSIFSLGDSNTMGYGLPGYKGNYGSGTYTDPYRTYLKGIEGCYTDAVADTLSIDDSFDARVCMAYPAFRAKDMCYFLGLDVEKDDFYESYKAQQWNRCVIPDSGGDGVTVDNGPNFVNSIKAKDGDNKLILVYAGVSDVIFSSTAEVLEGGVSLDDIPGALKNLATTMWANYNSFLKYFPMLIERIQELNKDATIVIVGTFNPIKDLKLTEGTDWLPAFEGFSAITALMNQNYRQWAKEYGCKYADITNVETKTIDIDFYFLELISRDAEVLYHATPEGYQYIARQILKTLETEKTVTTDIVVDLGSVKNISSVRVDGAVVTDYTYDGSILTIPSSVPIAKTLTVTEKRDNGTFLITYQLSYDGTGYNAYRLYATRDINYTFKSIISTIMSLIKPIIDSLFGFLK